MDNIADRRTYGPGDIDARFESADAPGGGLISARRDIFDIFPNPEANANDPHSYNFGPTDQMIASMSRATAATMIVTSMRAPSPIPVRRSLRYAAAQSARPGSTGVSNVNSRLVTPPVDVITTAMSLYIVNEARALGAPRVLIARMLANVALDGLVGAVPILGDAFDVAFRANRRNMALLLGHFDRSQVRGTPYRMRASDYR